MIKILALFAALFFLPASAQAGAWVPEPGHGYAKVSLRGLPGSGYSPGPDQSGEPVAAPIPIGAYFEGFVNTYVELGIFPGVALVGSWSPLRSFVLQDPRDGRSQFHSSPGDPRLGGRVAIVRSDAFVAAIQLTVTAPLASGEPVQTVYGSGSGNPEVGALRVGAGVWELEAVAQIGGPLLGGYFTGGGGATARGGGFDALLIWNAELGRTLRQGIDARLRITGQHPLPTGSAEYHRSPSGLGNGSRVVSFTLELDLKLRGPFSLSLGLAGALGPVARQIYGPVFNIGLAAQW